MNAEQTTGGSGTVAERKNSGGWPRRTCRVIPTDQLVSVLENLLAPATGLCWKATTRNRPISSRMLAEVNPQKFTTCI